MTEKGLSDSGCRSAELRYEWQSFLGLLPLLDLRPMDPVLYQRCLTAVWRSRKSAISRTDLQQAAGLAFQAEALGFDLLIAQLVRDRILKPIVSSPFHFQIRRWNWTNPESVYAADDRLSLIAISREEQTARFRMVGLLSARISNPRLPEKRVQQIRKGRDELERIYEARPGWNSKTRSAAKRPKRSERALKKRRRRARSSSSCRSRRREISIWKEKQDATSKRG